MGAQPLQSAISALKIKLHQGLSEIENQGLVFHIVSLAAACWVLSCAAGKRVLVWFSTVAAVAAQPPIQMQIFKPSSHGPTKALATDTSGTVFAGGQCA